MRRAEADRPKRRKTNPLHALLPYPSGSRG
jgi:hypothetical protein